MKETRLVYCCGYFALINIIATLKMLNDNDKYDNILLFINNHLSLDENKIKSYIESINNNIFRFKEIFYVSKEDVINKNLDNIYKIKEKYPFIEEYWEDGHFFIEAITQLELKDIINYKKLIICDEGTGSYFIIFGEKTNKKIDKIYLLRPELLNYSEINKHKLYEINKEIYINTLREISNFLSIPIMDNSENSILFLNTLFWDETINNINIAEEINLINKLINDYNYIVYYKAHPRVKIENVLKIKETINHNNFKILDFNYDIESLLLYHKFSFIISYASSSLLNSFKYFKIPAFTYYNDFIEKNCYGYVQEIKEMIKIIVPNINNYFNNNNDNNVMEYYQKFQNQLQKKIEVMSIFSEIKKNIEYINLSRNVEFLLEEQKLNKNQIQQLTQQMHNNVQLQQDILQIKAILQKPNAIFKLFLNMFLAFMPKHIKLKIRKKLLTPKKLF